MDLRPPTPKTPLDPPPPRNSLCTVLCWENQHLHKEFGRLSPLLDPPARVPPKFFMQIFLGCFFRSWLSRMFLMSLDSWECKNGERAEYCFESTVSEERTHWVLRQTRWVLRETRWVRVYTQIIGWKELTEFAPRNSVSSKNSLSSVFETVLSSPKPYSARIRKKTDPVRFKSGFEEGLFKD